MQLLANIRNLLTLLSRRNITTNRMSKHTSALIFLHGLGDQGSSWHSELAQIIPAHIKCICPTAPKQSVTLNMGMRMNSWFDLRSLNPSDEEDETGIESACKNIHELIAEQEKQGIPHDRIMLGGFSQGGALSIYSALRYPKKLAGIVALSCWIPLNKKFPAAAQDANKNISMLQCHGDADPVVPLTWGKLTQEVLIKFMNKDNYEFKVYRDLGHSSSNAEISDILKFINKHLPK